MRGTDNGIRRIEVIRKPDADRDGIAANTNGLEFIDIGVAVIRKLYGWVLPIPRRFGRHIGIEIAAISPV